MKISEYIRHDALGLAELIRTKAVSAREACEAALAVHALTDDSITAVIETWPEDLDAALDAAPVDSPFRGVPFLIKDILLTMAGKRCEDGSRLAEGFTPSEDSALMRRFRAAGLITLGRNKTPEFGFSPTTETRFYGAARNPWDPKRSAGGSSGGAGSVVGARVVPMSHASDGGGSIRVPAAYCGAVGLKPTRGRVSAGPGYEDVLSGLGTEFIISRSVRDSAAMLDLVHGPEVGEPFEIASPEERYANVLSADPAPLRIGLMTHPLSGERSDPAVVRAVEGVATLCEALGHHVEPVTPDLGMSWDAFMDLNATIWCAGLGTWIEAMAAATGRTPDEEMLQPETLACYRYGRERSAADYLGALASRNVVTRRFAGFFADHDLLLSPTAAGLPLPLGSYETGWGSTGLDWTRFIFARCPFTPLFNVTGLPAISLPLAHDAATDLPVGIHFGAAFGREDLLLRVAGQLERAAPWIDRLPAVCRAMTD